MDKTILTVIEVNVLCENYTKQLHLCIRDLTYASRTVKKMKEQKKTCCSVEQYW